MARNIRKDSSAKIARTARKPEGEKNDRWCNEHLEKQASMPLKEKLLDHYAQSEPQAFRQFDGYVEIDFPDCFVVADSDNDSVTQGISHELWGSEVTVRVHVREGSRRNDAIRLLEKILEWIKAENCPYLECNKEALDRSFRAAHEKLPCRLLFPE